MKKKYTKKQITEAIAYWEKQLRTGNYRKVHESMPTDDEIRDQVERVMEKANDYFDSSDRDRFDRWCEDAKKWVEGEIRYGDSSFDELVKGAIAVITDND